uniref:NB-ARC domain-containing protein n=1 Tax=Fagus sylvatica TaxID=28930 RepID=A0A2N9GN18_FAGSY
MECPSKIIEKCLVDPILECLVERVRKHIGYLIHLNSNIKNLKVQFQKLDEISQALQRFIDEDVKANKMCLGGCCPDLKAKKKTLEIDAETRNDQVIASEVERWVQKFLEALRDDNINMIAICGMGGIGKTTMAKEVAKRAKDDKLFDEDVMAVVSQNQDVKKIQALNLTDIGIPYGGQHKRCKILLTSRSEEACNQMRSQKIVPIKVLSEEEAWNLFREMAGDCVDTPGLRPIAKEVAKECGALPVAIVTVGRALENKTKDEWIAALEQLKKSIPKNIPGLHSKVYSSIEFSYSYLKSDEAKSCFLLCCLFPEDFDIPIEYLVRYGVGRRLFAKIDNVAEARSRVHAMVNDLKRSFLLLDSKKEECVKMHDVVRDVAISIAEEHGFLVGCDDKMEEWPEKDTYGHYAAISLFSREIKRHPDGIECSKLELLQLSCSKNSSQTLPANLFQGMKELKVLSMRGMSFPSLPQSIQVLQNLRTLHLEYCELADVSTIGSLGNLEILSFLGSEIKELPREIGNLGHLKLLDLSECTTLQRIPYGLLSSLSRLEELYIGDVSVNWEPTGNSEGDNASLAELIPLCTDMEEIFSKEGQDEKAFDMIKFPQLKHVELYDVPRLIGFCTFVDPIELVQPSHAKGTQPILNQEDVITEFQHEQHHTGSFPQSGPISNKFLSSKTIFWSPNLGEVHMRDNNNLEVIFDLEGLMVHRQRIDVLAQLKTLRLWELSKLIYLFPPSIAKLLVELQSVNLEANNMMENIVQRDGEEEAADTVVVFPKVSSFKLRYLPNLMSFCVEAYSFEWPSMKEIEVNHCYKLKTFGSEIQSPRKQKKIKGLDSRPQEPGVGSSSVRGSPGFLGRCLECVPHRRNYGLVDLSDHMCPTKKSHGSSSVNKEKSLQEQEKKKEKKRTLFCSTKLTSFVLMDLPNLKCFCNEANAFEWPSLKKVGVIRCPNLRTFVPANLKTPELEGVYEDYDFVYNEFIGEPQWKGDLNATIEHIFKGKETEVKLVFVPMFGCLGPPLISVRGLRENIFKVFRFLCHELKGGG